MCALREENAKLQRENEMLRRVDAEKTAIIADLRRNFEASVRASDDRIAMAEAHFRERLAESERNKEIYLRFAVSINERLNSGIDQIMAAREIEGNSPTRPQMASSSPSGGPRRQPKQLDEIEQMIAEAVTEARGEARPATTNSEGQS